MAGHAWEDQYEIMTGASGSILVIRLIFPVTDKLNWWQSSIKFIP